MLRTSSDVNVVDEVEADRIVVIGVYAGIHWRLRCVPPPSGAVAGRVIELSVETTETKWDHGIISTTLLILFVTALLEAGGDALVRHVLHATSMATRLVFFLIGAGVLFAYSYTVNAPAWKFGRLLGVHVVFFSIAPQLISNFILSETPSRAVFLGGTFIVLDRAIVSLAGSN